VADRACRWWTLDRRRLLVGLVAAGGSALGGRIVHGHRDGAFRLLVAPFHGLYETARRVAPLAGWLERELRLPVSVHSAFDFHEFRRRLDEAFGVGCELVLTPGHFVAAVLQDGWQPVFDVVCGREIAFFGRIDAGLTGLGSVAEVRLALPDPLSLVALAALDHLRDRGLAPLRRIHFVGLGNVVEAVERGLAEMGAVPRAFYERMEAEETEEEEICRIVATFPAELRKTLLAHRDVPPATVERLRRSALAAGMAVDWLPTLGVAVTPPSLALYRRLGLEYGSPFDESYSRSSRRSFTRS